MVTMRDMGRKFEVFMGRRTIQDRDRAIPQEAAKGLAALATLARNYDTLRRAIFVALSEGDTGIQEFCEDFGVDQVDPVKKSDILRWALKACGELKDG